MTSHADKMDVDAPASPAQQPQLDATALLVADIHAGATLVDRAVKEAEKRFVTRALRHAASIRKKVSPTALGMAVQACVVQGSALGAKTIAVLGPDAAKGAAAQAAKDAAAAASTAAADEDAMAVDPPTSSTAAKKENAKPAAAKKAAAPALPSALPEVEAYLALLAIIYLHDAKRYAEGAQLAAATVEHIQKANRRPLDSIAAKVYFYHARFHELDPARDGAAVTALRPALLALHRTATLRGDAESSATLLNLVLRSLLAAHLVDHADKLVAKAGAFPASASAPQHARYLYYVARIRALQLDYSAAHAAAQQAVRRAPQGHAAAGFTQAATKLLVLVQLLMGEVPERATFRPESVRRALEPYRQLVLAVRKGDLQYFSGVVHANAAAFAKDGTESLVARLRHTVIKAGLRSLSVAYSAISLRDVCAMLKLDAEEDAEYMVARATRDGVLPAGTRIDHAAGVVRTGAAAASAADVYATAEPHKQFDARTKFCLQLHDEAVRAMRFPDQRRAGKKDKEDGEEEGDELRDLEAEIAAAMEEDDDF